MGIARYTATADAEITNAFKANLRTRATGSNMGSADTMGVFSIYGQADSGSVEKSRALVQFSTASILLDRNAGKIPQSGSVNFYLRMFNSAHPFTSPTNFTMKVAGVTGSSWTEGEGLDAEDYADRGAVNWMSSSVGSTWTNAGGDFYTAAPLYSQAFDSGMEDLKIDITHLVESWMLGEKANYGVGIMLDTSHEDGSEQRSYYIKKFHARSSEYFFKRPVLEARWDSSIKDNRGNFYYSSSLATTADNANQLVFYNHVRGKLANVPDLPDNLIYVNLYSNSGSEGLPTGAPLQSPVTGGVTQEGIYTASLTLASQSLEPSTYLYDVWFAQGASAELGVTGNEFHTGSAIDPQDFGSNHINPTEQYVTACANLKNQYSRAETARFRFYTRKENWCPTIYSKASQAISREIVEDAFWKIHRVIDDREVVSYGTGSEKGTRMSYDAEGNYFDLNMDLLEGGYSYGITLLYSGSYGYLEQSEIFKFRVG